MTTEQHEYKEPKSILEDAPIAPTGANPFADSNVWWYITGICLLGILGNESERTIYQLIKFSHISNFWKEQPLQFFYSVILPIICTIFSKIFFLVFIYRKWKFVAQANAETPYPANVVWSKYILPIIYFSLANLFIALIAQAATSRDTAYFFAAIRILLLSCGYVYTIVWSYRLMVEFPKYFNPIGATLNTPLSKLPEKIGLFLWLTPILATVFLYITFYLNTDIYSDRSESKKLLHLSQTLNAFWYYGSMCYYLILAIYIYVIMQVSKHIYNDTESLEADSMS